MDDDVFTEADMAVLDRLNEIGSIEDDLDYSGLGDYSDDQ